MRGHGDLDCKTVRIFARECRAERGRRIWNEREITSGIGERRGSRVAHNISRKRETVLQSNGDLSFLFYIFKHYIAMIKQRKVYRISMSTFILKEFINSLNRLLNICHVRSLFMSRCTSLIMNSGDKKVKTKSLSTEGF